MRKKREIDDSVPKTKKALENDNSIGEDSPIKERKEITWGRAIDKQKYEDRLNK
jgi:hypothetical protein